MTIPPFLESQYCTGSKGVEFKSFWFAQFEIRVDYQVFLVHDNIDIPACPNCFVFVVVNLERRRMPPAFDS
jgi:hypothetical protein